jgi:hypothetical protein
MRILLIAATALCLYAADSKIGKPFTQKTPITVDALYSKPDGLVGKTVQVKGKVTEVCAAMGCWMNLAGDSGKTLRIQVGHDGAIVFPKEGVGKMAIAEGKLEKVELTHEEAIAAAKHEADDAGRKFDPATVKPGPGVAYEIAGTGALILSN